MTLTIKYFGQLAEIVSRNEEVINFSGNTISDLLEILFEKYSKLKNVDFQVAQNNQIVNLETKILTNEIALLPPFAGG